MDTTVGAPSTHQAEDGPTHHRECGKQKLQTAASICWPAERTVRADRAAPFAMAVRSVLGLSVLSLLMHSVVLLLGL